MGSDTFRRSVAPPVPLDVEVPALETFLTAVESGAPFRDRWEDLLAAIPAELAYRMEWGSRESVGAAALLARWSVAGPALVVGSGFLGTAPALGILGRPIVQLDASSHRGRFARARGRALGARIDAVAAAGPELPFADASFALVVFPDAPHGLPHFAGPLDPWVREALRVLKPGGEILVLAHNRLAYKRFTGLHGRFEKRGPLGFIRDALSAGNPERTHRGYQRLLASAGFGAVRAFATYVSHLDYHYVSALRAGALPALEIGPKEKRNVAKWAAHRLGLFGWLAPSIAVLGVKPAGRADGAAAGSADSAAAPSLLDRIAARASNGAPVEIEQLLATRGNAALALLRRADGAPASVVRVPLCLKEVRLGRRHFEGIAAVRAIAPALPAPTPQFSGAIEGAFVCIEERLPGLNGAQLTDDPRTRARTYRHLAELLSQLCVGRERADDALLEELVFARARFVASRLRTPATSALVLRVADEIAERLRGREIPVVFAHADLRAKHCLVSPDGSVTGILDWGTYRARNLPLYDLLHFIVHDRKQQKDESLNAATLRALHPPRLAPYEEEALADYCARLRIDAELRRACELAYPIEVPATTMTHWEYDRPRWVETNFGDALAASAAPGRALHPALRAS